MQVADEELTARAVDQARSVETFLHYLVWLAVLPAFVYLAGFVLVRMPGYERLRGSSWGPILDYGFQTAGQNADVVIFGDSSALLAVDPTLMSQQIGMRIINLPNTIGSLPVIGDMTLRRYLMTNRPPKLIIFYFCAWDLDYERTKGSQLFEGEEMLARHGSLKQIADFGFHHPSELFYFPFRVYSGFGPMSLLNAVHSTNSLPEVVAHRGHVANHLPYPPLDGDCMLPALDISVQGNASVGDLMKRYSTSYTATMLYLAPVPACANVEQLTSSVKEHLMIAPPNVFSASDFTADSYYAHLEPSAVTRATHLLTDAARPRLENKDVTASW